jgi:hypothetical protein
MNIKDKLETLVKTNHSRRRLSLAFMLLPHVRSVYLPFK